MYTNETIQEIQKDIKNLKLKAYQPDKTYAQAFLEYLKMDGKNKKMVETLYSKDVELLNEWFEIYCKEYNCSKEEALERVVEGESSMFEEVWE